MKNNQNMLPIIAIYGGIFSLGFAATAAYKLIFSDGRNGKKPKQISENLNTYDDDLSDVDKENVCKCKPLNFSQPKIKSDESALKNESEVADGTTNAQANINTGTQTDYQVMKFTLDKEMQTVDVYSSKVVIDKLTKQVEELEQSLSKIEQDRDEYEAENSWMAELCEILIEQNAILYQLAGFPSFEEINASRILQHERFQRGGDFFIEHVKTCNSFLLYDNY